MKIKVCEHTKLRKTPIYYGIKNVPYKIRQIRHVEQLYTLKSDYIDLYEILRNRNNIFPFYIILEKIKIHSENWVNSHYKWVAKNYIGTTKNETLFQYIINDKYKLVEILNVSHIDEIISVKLIDDANIEIILNDKRKLKIMFQLDFLVGIWNTLKLNKGNLLNA